MDKIILIGCSKSKNPDSRIKPVPAAELYISPLFIKSLKYARRLKAGNGIPIHILSAKYGLLDLDSEVSYYDEVLSNSKKKNRQWGERVVIRLEDKYGELSNKELIILAGRKYYECLNLGSCKLQLPLDGLKMGERLHRLNELCR